MTVGAILLIAIGYNLVGILVMAIDVIHTFIMRVLLLIGAYKDREGNPVAYLGQVIKINKQKKGKQMGKSEKGFAHIITLLLPGSIGRAWVLRRQSRNGHPDAVNLGGAWNLDTD